MALTTEQLKYRIRSTTPTLWGSTRPQLSSFEEMSGTLLRSLKYFLEFIVADVQPRTYKQHTRDIIDVKDIILNPEAQLVSYLRKKLYNRISQYKSILEAHISSEGHFINGLILIEKFDGTEEKIYEFITKLELKYPKHEFDIAILRKKNIKDNSIIVNARNIQHAHHYLRKNAVTKKPK